MHSEFPTKIYYPINAYLQVSAGLLSSRVGKTIDVIIDEVDDEGAIGRSQWDAPEIDGSVFLNGETTLQLGDIVAATVTHADEYDLWAEPVR